MFEDYYSGSTLLMPVADKLGIGVDRLNFVSCQFVALFCAIFMKKYLDSKCTSNIVRHLFSSIIGLALSYFCFGNEIFHLLTLSIVCGLIMKYQNPHIMQISVFVFSIGYLAFIHSKRIIYNYGAYNLDITGPLMVMVQRVSGLAFSIFDGTVCEEVKLTPFRKKYVIKRKPSPLEYFGYLFQFQSILAGPNILFRDYLQFVDGTNFKNELERDGCEPSSFNPVVRKVSTSIVCMLIYLALSPTFPIETAKGSDFIENWSVVRQTGYLLMSTTLTRFMYYHAWILAEAVCNASGLGFNGYDEAGNPRWDLAQNVDIFGFEGADNLRNAIASWNTGTNIWLRFIVYERVDKYKTLWTFMLSAVWHGFYPGYYICFVSAAFFVNSARNVRKIIRPYFQASGPMKVIYDIQTFAVTKLIVSYFSFPFIMYDFWPAILIYKGMYFYLHILAIFSLAVLPFVRKILPKPPTVVGN